MGVFSWTRCPCRGGKGARPLALPGPAKRALPVQSQTGFGSLEQLELKCQAAPSNVNLYGWKVIFDNNFVLLKDLKVTFWPFELTLQIELTL